jgi:hypothetical protein
MWFKGAAIRAFYVLLSDKTLWEQEKYGIIPWMLAK